MNPIRPIRLVRAVFATAVLISHLGFAQEDEETFKLVVSDPPATWVAPDPQKAKEERVRKNIAILQQRGYLHGGDVEVFGPDRDIAIPLLRNASGVGTDGERAALRALIALGDIEARGRLFAAIEKADDEGIEDLRILDTDENGKALLLPRNADEERLLRNKLKNDFSARLGMELIEMPGIPALMVEKLPALPPKDQNWVAKVLVRPNMDPAIAKSLLGWCREKAAKEVTTDLADVLAELMVNGGPARTEAEELLLQLSKKDPEILTQEQHTALTFADGATKASEAILESMVKRSRDTVVQGHAMAALARQRGPAVLKDFAAELSKPSHSTWAVLSALAASGHREEADAHILRTFPTFERGATGYALQHGGNEVMERAVQSAPKLEKDLQFEIAWKSKGHRCEAFFVRLKELGIIERVPSSKEIEKARKGEGEPRLEATVAMLSLAAIGGQLTFDSEADEVPPRYDELFLHISQFTRGVFSPEGIRQKSPKAKVSIDSDEEEEELGPKIRVEFVSAGKLFSLTPARMGDYFDVHSVQSTVNRALELAGRKERLIPMENSGQEAIFVFGSPEAWQKIAEEYSLPLVGRSTAAEKGKDYERQLFETLKDGRK